jgi:hypothetical protein
MWAATDVGDGSLTLVKTPVALSSSDFLNTDNVTLASNVQIESPEEKMKYIGKIGTKIVCLGFKDADGITGGASMTYRARAVYLYDPILHNYEFVTDLTNVSLYGSRLRLLHINFPSLNGAWLCGTSISNDDPKPVKIYGNFDIIAGTASAAVGVFSLYYNPGGNSNFILNLKGTNIRKSGAYNSLSGPTFATLSTPVGAVGDALGSDMIVSSTDSNIVFILQVWTPTVNAVSKLNLTTGEVTLIGSNLPLPKPFMGGDTNTQDLSSVGHLFHSGGQLYYCGIDYNATSRPAICKINEDTGALESYFSNWPSADANTYFVRI